MKRSFWRGVRDVEFIDHGEWSDFEVRYRDIVANGYLVESFLAAEAEYYFGWDDIWDGTHEEEFSKWCRDNRNDVINQIYIAQSYDSKRYCFFDKLDGDNIVFDKPVFIDCFLGQIIVSELHFDDDDCLIARITKDIDEVVTDIDVVIPITHTIRNREFIVIYGEESFEESLIEAYAHQCHIKWLENHIVYY